MKKVWVLVVESKGIIDFVDLDDAEHGIDRLERASNLFETEFFAKDVTENKKVKIGSVWNPETSSFSEYDEERTSTAEYNIALVDPVDNTVKTIIFVFTKKRHSLWKAAELEGVIAIYVTEMEYSQLKIGMLWNGTTFTEKE